MLYIGLYICTYVYDYQMHVELFYVAPILEWIVKTDFFLMLLFFRFFSGNALASLRPSKSMSLLWVF